jgi:hypothetical protein
LNVSTSKSLSQSSDLAAGVSLGISEKIMRKLFYSGSFGYSTGVTPEYSLRDGTYFNTNHGVGYRFSEDLSLALTVGVDYDSNRPRDDEFQQKVSLSASYILWE